MFKLAEEHGLLFHPDAMHLVSRSLKLIDKKLRNNKGKLFVVGHCLHWSLPEKVVQQDEQFESDK